MNNELIYKRGKWIFDGQVTSIGQGAFNNCISLTSITIPNSVTEIGGSAFLACNNITSITIPNSVTSIGQYAFSLCKSLTSVIIPNSVTSLHGNSFSQCPSLSSLIVDKNNTRYDSREECNAIIETATNTLICSCPNTIIPSSVTGIGSQAFANSSVTSITIHEGVTSIGGEAFRWCYSLTSITIPKSVTSISYSILANCPSLSSIVVDSENPSYDSRENCNAIITKSNMLIAGCQNTIIPNSVKSIREDSFFGCTRLTSITIPESVTSIGNSAFAFCDSLASITCKAATPPTLGSSNNLSNVQVVYVPAESVEAYKQATNWSYYSDIIQAIP